MAQLEVLLPGQLSSPERVRGRALAIARGDITDAELMAWFLEERAASEATRSSYAAQLRRLDWFARRHLGLPSLRNLQREDWEALKSYLVAPPPEHIMKRSVGVEHEGWRPFRTHLSEASASQALGVMQAYMAWLAEPSIGALPHSPFGSLKVQRPRFTATGKEMQRYLPDKALQCLFTSVDATEATTLEARRRKERTRFLLTLGIMSGLRASEISRARSTMLQASPNGDWVIAIRRKGDVMSRLPVAPALVESWKAYRELLGLSATDATCLVGQIDGSPVCLKHAKSLTRKTIWALFGDACAAGARFAEERGDPHSAEILRRASTHWARHTFGVQLMDSGSDLRSARELLEHASLGTTSIYTHIDGNRRRDDLSKMTDRLADLIGER